MDINQELLFSLLYALPMLSLLVASGMCIFSPAKARDLIGFSRAKDGYLLVAISVMPIINIIVVTLYLHYRTFK